MEKEFIKIKPKKGIFKVFGVENTEINKIVLYPKRKIVELYCDLKNCSGFSELDIIEKNLKKKFGDEIKYNFHMNLLEKEINGEDFKLVLDRVINELKNAGALAKAFLTMYRFRLEDKSLIIEVKHTIAEQKLYASKVNEIIERKLKQMIGLDLTVIFQFGDFSKQLQKIDEKLTIELEKNAPTPEIKKAKPIKVMESKDDNVILGKEIKSKAISFAEFEEAFIGEKIVIVGQVFNLSSLDTRTGKTIFMFNITDLNNSISIKTFVPQGTKLDLKDDMWVKVSGKKQQDKFQRNSKGEAEDVIFINHITKVSVSQKERKDKSEQKRVELHAHTKMSEMDSVIEINELIKRAANWGHKSIAITDHGVVHAFPFAYNFAKKLKDFKVILGTEAYLVDDTTQMVKNPKDTPIEKETYVVFDLETTGFDPYNDQIIEIGAVKLDGNNIIDRYSAFINPERPIPQAIVDLTGITDEMVADARKSEEVLKEFLEFIGDSTVVAHNAEFDVGFITQKLTAFDIEFNNSVIDTLLWSRNILTDRKRHNLKTISKYFGISLNNHHRAVDDAEATAEIFKKFIGMVIRKNAYKLTEIDNAFENDIKNSKTYETSILVQNQIGLINMYKLISESHLEYFYRVPRIPKSLLIKYREGLIIGSGCEEGELVKSYLRGKTKEELKKIAEFYDYLEIQPDSNKNALLERGEIKSIDEIHEMNKFIYELGKSENKIVVATGDAHYLDPEDEVYQKILVYGKNGPRSDYKTNKEQYLKTTDEMLNEFSYLGTDISYEIVVENTNKIADMIDKVQPIPDEFCPPEIEGAETQVEEMTYAKAKKIYGDPIPENIQKRLARELEAIIGNGFAVLYLIAQKLVKKSLDDGYLVGSRGSVGSSLVAYMMDITEVNALYPHYRCPECKYLEFKNYEGCGVDLEDKLCPNCGTKLIKDGYSIPFEVFMGFEGEKVPDIDLNFSGEYQGKVHDYTEELFGKENVFKAGTISTLATKNAYGYVKKYTEENFLEKNTAEMTRLARGCENVRKTTGQHPGGMIVVPYSRSIYEFTPIQKPANDMKSTSITTHFDYHVMDEQLVKLDILGHDDPTTIKLLQEYTGLNIYDIPLADPATLKLFSSTESLGITEDDISSPVGTFGVPEFGTKFVRQMLIDTRPTTFAELVRISGLSHGTDVWLNNAQEYIKNGTAKLTEVISVRDDIMNYLIDNKIEKGIAFQIMEFVRKGRPSKDPEKWEEYATLMKKHNVKSWYIESCKKIKYMFPKGHAAAYVMMAMRIAYFKVHYPEAFYAAFLTRKAFDFNSETMLHGIEKIKEKRKELDFERKLDVKQKSELVLLEILIEMHCRGIKLLNVDVYKSEAIKFKIENGKIRMPLITINGLGESVVKNIITEREKGNFISFEDLRRRTKASKTVTETLKEYKAIDEISEFNQQQLF